MATKFMIYFFAFGLTFLTAIAFFLFGRPFLAVALMGLGAYQYHFITTKFKI